jgi:hypothetical protein
MTPLGTIILAVAATSGGGQSDGRGVQIASAQVQVEIVRPAIVRQASGLEVDRDGPAPQISRRGRTILVEFQ